MWEMKLGWRTRHGLVEKPMVEVFFTTFQQSTPKGHIDDQWVGKERKT